MKLAVVLLLSAVVVGHLAAAPDLPLVPSLLANGLRQLPGLRLLDQSSDLLGGITVDDLKDYGYWPPWLVRDLDRDGRPDVAAVVVKPGPRLQYGVIAIHARNSLVAEWVTPLGTQLLNGIAKGDAADTLIPLFCVECDSNSWFRWSGRAYEAELYAVREELTMATYDEHAVGLFARPSRNSRLLFPLMQCTRVVVRRVAGTTDARWYFVETRSRKPVDGWIPASFVFDGGGGCEG